MKKNSRPSAWFNPLLNEACLTHLQISVSGENQIAAFLAACRPSHLI